MTGSLPSARTVGEVLAVLEARLPPHWAVAPYPAALLMSDDMTGQVSPYSDRAVSMEAQTTEWASGDRGTILRARRGALESDTTVLVHWLYAVPLDDGSHPYRAALDAEASLVSGIIRPDGEPVRALARTARRRITQEGWVVGTLTVQCEHSMPLTIPSY